jgi:undecaprenyl-diphosphatase
VNPFWLVVATLLLIAAWRWRGLGRVGRAMAAAMAVVAVLFGTGVLALPSVEEIVQEVGGRLGDWTYVLVGASAFLETAAFLGFVAPGETMVLFGGVLAGEGTIELVPLIAVVWISAMLGDLGAYLIGRRYGRDFLLRYGARVRIGEPQVQVVETFFERHGDLTVFFGRWIGVVRPLVPFLAGSTRLSFARFAAVDVVATFLWSAVLCVVGSVFWQNFDQVVGIVSRTLFIFGAIVVVVVFLSIAVATRRSRRRSAAFEAWIETQLTERAMVGRPVSAVWVVITRIEPRFPGRRGRGGPPAPTDTVPGESGQPSSAPEHDPSA